MNTNGFETQGSQEGSSGFLPGGNPSHGQTWTLSEMDFESKDLSSKFQTESEEKMESNRNDLKTRATSEPPTIKSQKSPTFNSEFVDRSTRLKSSQRLQYDAQVMVIKKQIGEIT